MRSRYARPTMRWIAVALAGALLLGCRNNAELEARVKKLEDINAKYAADLEFLRSIHERQTQQTTAPAHDEPATDTIYAVDITPNVGGGLVVGPAAGAPVTIIEAWDFASPYCERIDSMMDDLVKDYGGKVRVVYKNMAAHPPAMNAHLAACAAGKQGRFAQFKGAYWAKAFRARKLDDATLAEIAKDVGLDAKKFAADKDGDACKQLVDADQAELAKFHVSTTTPSFFVNGTFLSRAPSTDDFKRLIDDKLRTAGDRIDFYEKVIVATGEKQFKADPKN